MRSPGCRARSAVMSGRAVSSSPTDTAWIQIDDSASMLNDTGR